jgi:hypothetical protein
VWSASAIVLEKRPPSKYSGNGVRPSVMDGKRLATEGNPVFRVAFFSFDIPARY